MEVATCSSCKRLFNYIGGQRLCPACRDNLEKKFQEVKQYVRDNPNSSISDVSTEMDVPVSQIKLWIRQERLAFTEDSKVMIECERCGMSIRTGRFCEKCKKNMTDTLGSLYHHETEETRRRRESDKMRHLK